MAKDPRIPAPPPNLPWHRGWRVWYDAGEMASGSCVRETAWRAITADPANQGAHLQLVGGSWNDVLAGIDREEDEAGRTRGPILPRQDNRQPIRAAVPFVLEE